jgi:hypothetical protein
MANAEHLAVLRSGVPAWNAWRQRNGTVRPAFSRARLFSADLTDADLSGAHLAGANLGGANLGGAILVRTNLRGSTLNGCNVYGASVWGVRLAGASQVGLIISDYGEPQIAVDDLEVAQFVHLLLSNAKLRNVIDTMGTKAVLLLGRFTETRKAVLEALHAELRRLGYLPIPFTFDRPTDRDTTETVVTLAGLARFVIADLTDAASVQQELTAIAALPSVPVQPIVARGQSEWSMFVDLQRRGLVFPPHVYDSADALLSRWPEILRQVLEPEVVRQHPGLPTCGGGREVEHPFGRFGREGVDGRGLAIRRDLRLQGPPELVHRIQLGRLRRQPEAPDPQGGRAGLRAGAGVRRRAVEQEPDRPRPTIAAPQFAEERLRVGDPGMAAREHHPVRGAHVDRAEQHPLRVLARDWDHGLRPGAGPRTAQRREQAQQRPVREQQHVARPKARPMRRARAPFSGRDAARVRRRRTAAVSTGSPTPAAAGAACAR